LTTTILDFGFCEKLSGEAFLWGDTALGRQCPTCSQCRRLCQLEGTAERVSRLEQIFQGGFWIGVSLQAPPVGSRTNLK